MHSCNIHLPRCEAVDGRDTYGLSERSCRSMFGKLSITVGGLKSIHSIPTWCGLGIQVTDASYSKSRQHFCCKNGILQDICFSVARQGYSCPQYHGD
ncbi:hypothetical protein AVEN_155283-1 [Araneus ventricosus]|uniref:Uncharacterized protein n=1 Tax=Araneus ventricosus TaxID=182803 RepID=A0A4Y2D6H7_ARAVE|nr:hypothetical protein AVEN_155283-1 [Araneus ventricosus]